MSSIGWSEYFVRWARHDLVLGSVTCRAMSTAGDITFEKNQRRAAGVNTRALMGDLVESHRVVGCDNCELANIYAQGQKPNKVALVSPSEDGFEVNVNECPAMLAVADLYAKGMITEWYTAALFLTKARCRELRKIEIHVP